jgi:1-acyl-sn-glycerol-3-phosphate acyltransferase
MLQLLPPPIVGTIALSLLTVNTVFWVALFIPVIAARLVVASARFRQRCSAVLVAFAWRWVGVNSWVIAAAQNLVWDVALPEGLDPTRSYLVVCNHRSWTDIFVLQHVFRGRVPFLRFFLKKELIWVPFLGIAWWALEFPFMQRYSRSFLAKHPELRGRDMETTRRHCEKFRNSPVSVLNFLEGTRFTPGKHLAQESPFAHLLKPRAGGVAYVLAAMGDALSGVLDVTIAYPDHPPDAMLWRLLQGKIPRVVVRARLLPLPADTVGRGYLADDDFSGRMRAWVDRLWQEKDRLLDRLHGPAGS